MTHPNTLSVSPNPTVATCSAICNVGCMVQSRTHDGVREGVRGSSPMQEDRVTYQRTESPGTAVFEGVFMCCNVHWAGSWLQYADSKQQRNMTDDNDTAEYENGEKRPLDHGVKVRAKVKRGTGTRDQDTLLIEGRGEDAQEAAYEFEKALDFAESEEWAGRLRELQPEEDAE